MAHISIYAITYFPKIVYINVVNSIWNQWNCQPKKKPKKNYVSKLFQIDIRLFMLLFKLIIYIPRFRLWYPYIFLLNKCYLFNLVLGIGFGWSVRLILERKNSLKSFSQTHYKTFKPKSKWSNYSYTIFTYSKIEHKIIASLRH